MESGIKADRQTLKDKRPLHSLAASKIDHITKIKKNINEKNKYQLKWIDKKFVFNLIHMVA